MHQTGAMIRKKTAAPHFTLADGTEVAAGEIVIPARPYLGISEDERETILELTTGYFENLLLG